MKTMTGRERVWAALKFAPTDRTPRDLWSLPGLKLARPTEYAAVVGEYPLDTAGAAAAYPPSDRGLPAYPQPGSYTDHWGSVWRVGEPGVIGEVKQPALADWAGLPAYRAPWARLAERDFAPVHRFCAETDRFVLSEWTANPFERLQFLRGTENLFLDLAYGVEEVRTLLQLIHEYNLEDLRGWCTTPVDGIVFCDDWGSNRSLLINPRTWRELFRPLYAEYVALIHAAGKAAFFHSDGNIEAIYGDLVEIGIDAINSQLFVMNIEELGRLYGGKITFWGELDRQRVLPFGTPEQVRAAVLRVRRALDCGRGGVIAQMEWGLRDPQENILAAFAAWEEPLD
jgi:hypothetical protein